MSERSAAMARLVRQRACDRCEYCRTHQSLQVATFHIEHIVPIAAGGTSSLENVALACPTCNLHKSNRLSAADPESGSVVRLFHPRLDIWSDHFEWLDYAIAGKTAVGRATALAFDMNSERRLKSRRAEERFGLFPPG
jgi:hypothetical protein